MEFPHGSKDINFSITSDPSAPPPQPEKEHMFEKVVTPSDVGKLNRLVLPKQYAEKYLPLDYTANDKGLLLSFEDRHGKPWCFRYSYWNSSQSYVITKGWSRFVKDHRLDAGDTVYFSRGRGHRLFIDFKRRQLPPLPAPSLHNLRYPLLSLDRSTFFPSGGKNLYYPSVAAAAAMPCVGVQDRVLDSVPVVSRQAAAKRVRLFGVNLECPESDGGAAPARLLARSDLPHLQLRLGGFSDEQHPTLDLDL